MLPPVPHTDSQITAIPVPGIHRLYPSGSTLCSAALTRVEPVQVQGLPITAHTLSRGGRCEKRRAQASAAHASALVWRHQ